jgi:hypothetical protein
MLDTRATRVANAVQYQVNEAITQFFPELMTKATSIVNSEQMLIEKFPQHKASIRELCQLKLDTLAPNYVMDRIKHQKDQAQKEVIRRVKVWAKDYSFGAYLDAKGQIDSKKMKRDFVKNGGQAWVRAVVAEFNEKMVPYANQLRKELGAEYTASERRQGEKLNIMLVKHNQLVMRNKPLLQAVA